MQKYVAQASDKLKGGFEVASWNEIENQYIPIEFKFPSLETAEERAHQLNQEDYEYEHQDELIDKYHDYALSDDVQKINAAKEFFQRFPYQRDVCEEILKQFGNR